jgi:phosphoenolpyruvate synthase/pyruvate phosphate dikinase
MYEDKEVSDINIDSIIKLRKQTDRLSSGTDIVVRKSLPLIFPNLKDYVHVLTIKEIKTEKTPSIEELQKRDIGFFYTDNNIFVGESKENIENKYSIILNEETAKDRILEITGNMANPGKVTGRVRKVMGHQDIPLIKDGEILVSPMTMPDFVVAMEKASAFVTDEGGILCHAAIVAREMKKPCIVGTSIATQVLEDGDMVEVNADRGVIKIIKKSKDGGH